MPLRLPFVLLLIAVVAQAAAIVITWPLWNVRSTGLPALPVFSSLPQISVGELLLVTLVVIPVWPRLGVWLHFLALLAACLFDQMRTQPQFLATWILMVAATYQTGAALTRWFLASLWIWAGLHKFISPDWFSHRSADMSVALGLDVEAFSFLVAVTVAATEILVGLLACFKPRWAALGCVALHVGIVIYLSPLFLDWNYSVFPWNLTTAVIGFWVLWHAESKSWFGCDDQNEFLTNAGQPPSQPLGASSSGTRSAMRSRHWMFECIAFVLLMIVPAGFYVGLVDHGYAHVLYSDSIPRGMITRDNGTLREIKAWGELAVPFPNERRTLKQHFGEVARVGEKLHIRDPRSWLPDLHLQMTDQGPIEISRQAFFVAGDGIAGLELDSVRAKFKLAEADVKLFQRDPQAMVWLVEFPPQSFDTKLLHLLSGVSNVEEIELAGTHFTDRDIDALPPLPKLVGLALSRTKVTDRGIKQLMIDRGEKFPQLEFILTDETDVSDEILQKFNASD